MENKTKQVSHAYGSIQSSLSLEGCRKPPKMTSVPSWFWGFHAGVVPFNQMISLQGQGCVLLITSMMPGLGVYDVGISRPQFPSSNFLPVLTSHDFQKGQDFWGAQRTYFQSDMPSQTDQRGLWALSSLQDPLPALQPSSLGLPSIREYLS